MPKTVHVTLAGRQYPIVEKPIGVASVWRDRLRKSKAMLIFESLDVAMMQLVAVGDSITDEDGKMTSWANVNVSEVIGVAKILPVVVNGLASSIDEIEDMIFAYSPELAADREWIEQNAYDDEAVSVFVEVLKICYPIMAVWGLVRGPQAAQTGRSLPSKNGVSGQSKAQHRKIA